ncbi:MAG TPA: zf-HC2 domain-containing protein [Acidobacteriota bacterium]|nr:zf-HC2 domain-containing protein [Acidobacteriota bacterium]
MNCGDFDSKISEYLDGELPAGERDRFDAHVRSCAACRREVNALLEAQRLLVANLPQLEPAPRIWAGVADALSAPEPHRWWDFLRSRPWVLAGSAAAFLAVIGAGIFFWQTQRGVFSTMNLQRELEAHVRYRASVVAQGNPFQTNAAPADNRARDPENPFSPYLRGHVANPFMEMDDGE